MITSFSLSERLLIVLLWSLGPAIIVKGQGLPSSRPIFFIPSNQYLSPVATYNKMSRQPSDPINMEGVPSLIGAALGGGLAAACSSLQGRGNEVAAGALGAALGTC